MKGVVSLREREGDGEGDGDGDDIYPCRYVFVSAMQHAASEDSSSIVVKTLSRVQIEKKLKMF